MSVYAYSSSGQSSAAGQSESGDVNTYSQNNSATNSTINVTDFNSVKESFGFADGALAFAADTVTKTLAALNDGQKAQGEILKGTVSAAVTPFERAAVAAEGAGPELMKFAVVGVVGFLIFRAIQG